MELLMIYKISPNPSLPKRGRKERSFPKRGRERELFAKKGYFPSLWPSFSCRGQAREVRRDFIKQ